MDAGFETTARQSSTCCGLLAFERVRERPGHVVFEKLTKQPTRQVPHIHTNDNDSKTPRQRFGHRNLTITIQAADSLSTSNGIAIHFPASTFAINATHKPCRPQYLYHSNFRSRASCEDINVRTSRKMKQPQRGNLVYNIVSTWRSGSNRHRSPHPWLRRMIA